MAFSSLSIEQLTFEADDRRCTKQSIDSFESLVNYDSEFPKKESLVFKSRFFQNKKAQSTVNDSNTTSSLTDDDNDQDNDHDDDRDQDTYSRSESRLHNGQHSDTLADVSANQTIYESSSPLHLEINHQSESCVSIRHKPSKSNRYTLHKVLTHFFLGVAFFSVYFLFYIIICYCLTKLFVFFSND